MGTDNNALQIVKTMLDNGIVGNWDIVRPLVADDLVIFLPIGLPYGGTYRGWQGYRDVFAAMGEFWGDITFGPSEFFPAHNKVTIVSYLKGRVAKTGKSTSMPLAEVWEVRDGKVSRITAFYFDTKTIADAAQ